MSEINTRKFPYLSEAEADSFAKDNKLEQAKSLNTERYNFEQDELKRAFVENAEKTNKDRIQRKAVSDSDQIQEYLRATGNNEIAALDMFLYNRADYRNEINMILNPEGTRKIDYSGFAAKAGSASFQRYLEADKFSGNRAAITTAQNPGQASTLDVTVSQNIAYRAENMGNIMPLIDKVNLPFGNYDEPFYNKYSIAGYLTETGTIPEIDTDLNDATNGLKKTQWVVKDFAVGLKQSFRSLSNVSPSVLAQLLGFLTDAMNRGMEFQAISGPGTGQTDSGVITVATSATVGADIYETFQNALAAVESVNVRTSDITAVMNPRTWRAFKKLKVINQAYREAVGQTNIEEIPVVVVPETIIATTSNAATVVLGNFKHYLSLTNGGMQKYELTDPMAMTKSSAYHLVRNAKARFADSFAKFTVSGL